MTFATQPASTEGAPAAALDLSACHREPIHVPGAIQPHGVLLALSGDEFTIQQASRSSKSILGVEADDILGRPIAEVLGEDARSVVSRVVERLDGAVTSSRLPVVLFGTRVLFDALLHRNGGLVVLELENPRPLSEGRNANGPAESEFDVVQQTVAKLALCQTVAKLALCQTVEAIGAVVTRELRETIGFDRVMVYKFEEDGHGWVVAESKADDLPPYLGLHYPATDIPQQARRLYASNWLRLISDVAYVPSPLVPPENPLTDEPLDLSKSVLRSVSPVHIQYLKNMGVGASMSISLMRGDRLWGLIACHHRTPKFVPHAQRMACTLLGTVLSAQIVALEQTLRASIRSQKQELLAKLLESVGRRGSVTAGLVDDPETLLALTDASGAAVSFAGEVSLVGSTPDAARVEQILSHLEEHQRPEIYATERLSSELPDARRELSTACGLLAVRFPSGDYVAFFRPEVVQTVRWAGNPHSPAAETPTPGSKVPLSPRASFDEWAETVREHSLPWDRRDLQLAQELRNGLSVHILRREADLAKLNRQLAAKNEEMAQFLYTVSHDLKSPLVTCRGFVGLLRDDVAQGHFDELDEFAMHVDNAAAHMSRMIEDLLALYQLGRSVRPPVTVSLHTFAESLQAEFRQRLEQASAQLLIADDLPTQVEADPTSLRRVVENLLSNALKYACSGDDRRLELGGCVEPDEVRLYVRDHGPGVPANYRERAFQIFQRLNAPKSVEGSGVGLASVANVMRLHGGRAWVEETTGGGATFWLAFPNEGQAWSAVGASKTTDSPELPVDDL